MSGEMTRIQVYLLSRKPYFPSHRLTQNSSVLVCETLWLILLLLLIPSVCSATPMIENREQGNLKLTVMASGFPLERIIRAYQDTDGSFLVTSVNAFIYQVFAEGGVNVIASGDPFIGLTAVVRDRISNDLIVADRDKNAIFRISGDGDIGLVVQTEESTKLDDIIQDTESNDWIVTDRGQSRIYRVTQEGEIKTIAASLDEVRGVIQDSETKDFIVCASKNLIRIKADGTLVRIVKQDQPNPLNLPNGLVQDQVSGDFFVVDESNHALYKVTPGGIITKVSDLKASDPYYFPIGITQERETDDFIVTIFPDTILRLSGFARATEDEIRDWLMEPTSEEYQEDQQGSYTESSPMKSSPFDIREFAHNVNLFLHREHIQEDSYKRYAFGHFELKVKPPEFFIPGEGFTVDIAAENTSDQTFVNGDITVSFRGEVTCEVMEHNATGVRQITRGTRIFSVEAKRSIPSEDPIVQALKDDWHPRQVVNLQLKLATSAPKLTMLVRAAGKLKDREELIFEPASEEYQKDQQGLPAVNFFIESFPIGILQAEQAFQKYVVRLYRDQDSWEGSFEILRDGRRVYARKVLFPFGIIKDDVIKFMGEDITGDGKPNLVISEYTGGAHCCSIEYIFEIGEEFRKIATIDGMHSEPGFIDLDGDKKLEIVLNDWTFAYWRASFSESPAPEVILRFSDGAYQVAADLMRKLAPDSTELAKRAKDVLDSDNWDRERGEIPSSLWSYMLDLIYTGHADLSWQFFEMAWPPDFPGKDEFLSDFWGTLSCSPYWNILR